jgi:phosphatidate cytidylyltransferase
VLRDRVLSAAVLIPILGLVLLLGQPWLALVVLAVTALAAWEVFQLLHEAGYATEPPLGAAIAVLVVASAWLFADRAGESATMVAIGIAVAGVAGLVQADPHAGFQTWLATSFGALYASLMAFLLLMVENAGRLPASAPIYGLLPDGRAWLLIAVLAVWAYDSGAYLVGRRYGRHHFIPAISPGKTLEGVAGGVVATVVVTILTLGLAGQPLLGALLLGPLVAVAAQAGDLVESMLKRAASVKDSGHLIPGHGGMLDRVDSLLFAVPAAYFYLLMFGATR